MQLRLHQATSPHPPTSIRAVLGAETATCSPLASLLTLVRSCSSGGLHAFAGSPLVCSQDDDSVR
jgi:hypothetical protein